MNGAAITFVEENGNGSDSDANSDDAPEYYQPISAVEDDDDMISDGEHGVESQQLPNGHGEAENGISSLDWNDGVEQKSSDDEEEDAVEEERRRVEALFRNAFQTDENRRNAPLTPENASRVMEAMRGVTFAGEAPQWASQVPEDRWIEQLRRLRRSPNN